MGGQRLPVSFDFVVQVEVEEQVEKEGVASEEWELKWVKVEQGMQRLNSLEVEWGWQGCLWPDCCKSQSRSRRDLVRREES